MSPKPEQTSIELPEQGGIEVLPPEYEGYNRQPWLVGMTPETVDGMVKVAEESTKQAIQRANEANYTHAIPAAETTKQATEATKQAQEVTKRDWIRYGVRGCVAVIALIALKLIPTAGASIVGIVGILSAAEAGSNLIDKWKKGT